MDLTAFAAEIGGPEAGDVTIAGSGTRGGAVPGVRCVAAPSGIEWLQPDEMTACCGAATPVDVLDAALAEVGQCVAIPSGGSIGGALAVGRSGIRRLGYGPVRDVLLQVRYVSAAGEIVTAGGPTVKNVSGFDLCRLLVGSRGTLGFFGEMIVRTRPLPAVSQWFVTASTTTEPGSIFAGLYRPTSVLWDGERTWVLLEGDGRDVEEQAAAAGLDATVGPPPLPSGGRWSVPPSAIASVVGTGRFVAEIGVGIVHHEHAAPPRSSADAVVALHRRIKGAFDPTYRLNPGVNVLDLDG